MGDFTNSDPFEPWNDPFSRDDPFAPWNEPFYKDDPFAPWNSAFGHYGEKEEQEYHYKPYR
jgi:hypothetical protein